MPEQIITIKAARINSGHTVDETAAMLNVTAQTIYNIESGKSLPDIRQARKMSDYYGMPLALIKF